MKYRVKDIYANIFIKGMEDGISETIENDMKLTPYIQSYGQRQYGDFGQFYIRIDENGERVLIEKNKFEKIYIQVIP